MTPESPEQTKVELEARRTEIMRKLSELAQETPALQEHGPDDQTFKTRQALEAELIEIDRQLSGN